MSISVRLLVIAFFILCSSCALLFSDTDPKTTEERMSAFPLQGHELKGEVSIQWNEKSVPFIFAQNDDDLAYTLGLVHMHLREGQMELFKRLASGRISEMAGPFTRDLDRMIRTIGLRESAKVSWPALPERERNWINSSEVIS